MQLLPFSRGLEKEILRWSTESFKMLEEFKTSYG